MQIVDLLENLGYRVAIYSCDCTLDSSGMYKGEQGVKYTVQVCLKRHEDSLNQGLILNGISPWFFAIIYLLIKRADIKWLGNGKSCRNGA